MILAHIVGAAWGSSSEDQALLPALVERVPHWCGVVMAWDPQGREGKFQVQSQLHKWYLE